MFGIGKDTGIRDAVGITFTVVAVLLLLGVAARLPASNFGVDSAWANEVTEVRTGSDAEPASCAPAERETPSSAAGASVRTEALI